MQRLAFSKRLILLVALAAIGFATPALVWPQQLEDVVYLTDGSVIRGVIVEQVPGQSILIQTRDGNRLRFTMDRIQRMTREAAPSARVNNRKSPVAAGLLSALIGGAGQAYNGEWGKAGLFFGGQILFYGAAVGAANSDECVYNGDCSTAGVFALLWLGNGIWSIVDAVSSAKRINRQVSVGPVHVTPELVLLPEPYQGRSARVSARLGFRFLTVPLRR